MSVIYWRPEDVPASCIGCRPGCPEVCDCCPRNVSHSGLIPADASPLEALARFEADPRGVVSWLAQQREGQSRHLSARWVALIQAEAKERMRNME